jgi:hypothetical protein
VGGNSTAAAALKGGNLDAKELAAIQALDSATNQRSWAEQSFGVRIGPCELIYGDVLQLQGCWLVT